jgi:hypothetical protein
LVVAAHQQTTFRWWQERRHDFEIFVSELVLREAEAGDPEAAARRLELLRGLPRLILTEDVLDLAAAFQGRSLLPPRAAEDGLHIAMATVHQLDYLLTWNCSHIANPEIQARLAEFLAVRGLALPYICTPEVLLGGEE